MRLHPVVLAAVASLTIAACQSQANAGTATGLSDADRAALQASFDSSAARVRAHNWDAWASVLTDDALFMPPNHPAIHGRAAARAWVDSFPTITEFNFTNVAIDGVGNLAWGTTAIPMTITVGGQAVKDMSKQLAVLKKQPDGQWKVVAVAFSSDLPPMAPPPAAPAPAKKK